MWIRKVDPIDIKIDVGPSVYHVDSLGVEGRYGKIPLQTLFKLTFSSKSEFLANSSLLLAFLVLKTNNIYVFIKYVHVDRGGGGGGGGGGVSKIGEKLSTWYMDGPYVGVFGIKDQIRNQRPKKKPKYQISF